MTLLAHAAALNGIPVDTGRLYDDADPGYQLFLWTVVDLVAETVRKQQG